MADFAALTLIAATLPVSLVAGFLFAFEVVIMPGIGRLGDRDFLRAFQVIDGVIQNNQPLFVLVWVGSVVALIAATALGWLFLDGSAPWLISGCLAAYLLGVQLPTATINIPLNNRIQRLELETLDEHEARAERERFESRWNRSNRFRTLVSITVTTGLLIALTQLA